MEKQSSTNLAVTIRRMTADDLMRVHQLDQICFSSPWTLQAFRNQLEENKAASQWVAVLGEETAGPGLIVGAIVTWLVMDDVHIATLSVDPDYRRLRIASRLICTALRDGVSRGATASTLEVRASNRAAQRLYYKFGYQLVGRRPGYYQDNGEDAILLTLHELDEIHLDLIGCQDKEA
ncbi:MAG: ribosomal protein S18-alanine N-acetyltransferase [Anaerolineales bacterium]|nr:ribosomal protein S18-alanine N-acetyltransferase [Anaerolineales bacterium]